MLMFSQSQEWRDSLSTTGLVSGGASKRWGGALAGAARSGRNDDHAAWLLSEIPTTRPCPLRLRRARVPPKPWHAAGCAARPRRSGSWGSEASPVAPRHWRPPAAGDALHHQKPAGLAYEPVGSSSRPGGKRPRTVRRHQAAGWRWCPERVRRIGAPAGNAAVWAASPAWWRQVAASCSPVVGGISCGVRGPAGQFFAARIQPRPEQGTALEPPCSIYFLDGLGPPESIATSLSLVSWSRIVAWSPVLMEVRNL